VPVRQGQATTVNTDSKLASKVNSRNFVLIAAVLSLLGLIVNAGFDLDNVYDMTTTTLFALAFVFAMLGAFWGRMK
jgi:hypothetical protein